MEAAAVGAQIHHELAPIDHFLLVLLRDAGVAGQDDLDITVLLGEGLGQGVHHVAKAAGLDKGIAFRADKCHAAARLRQVHNRFVHFRFLRSFFFDLRLLFGGSHFHDRRGLDDGRVIQNQRLADNSGVLGHKRLSSDRGVFKLDRFFDSGCGLNGGLRLLCALPAGGGLFLRLGSFGTLCLPGGLLRRRLFCGRLPGGRLLHRLGGGSGFSLILGSAQLGGHAFFGLISTSLFTRHFYSPLFRIQP